MYSWEMLGNFHCCLWTQQDGRGQKQVWSSAAILVFVLTTSNCTLVTKIDPDTTHTLPAIGCNIATSYFHCSKP